MGDSWNLIATDIYRCYVSYKPNFLDTYPGYERGMTLIKAGLKIYHVGPL